MKQGSGILKEMRWFRIAKAIRQGQEGNRSAVVAREGILGLQWEEVVWKV